MRGLGGIFKYFRYVLLVVAVGSFLFPACTNKLENSSILEKQKVRLPIGASGGTPDGEDDPWFVQFRVKKGGYSECVQIVGFPGAVENAVAGDVVVVTNRSRLNIEIFRAQRDDYVKSYNVNPVDGSFNDSKDGSACIGGSLNDAYELVLYRDGQVKDEMRLISLLEVTLIRKSNKPKYIWIGTNGQGAYECPEDMKDLTECAHWDDSVWAKLVNRKILFSNIIHDIAVTADEALLATWADGVWSVPKVIPVDWLPTADVPVEKRKSSVPEGQKQYLAGSDYVRRFLLTEDGLWTATQPGYDSHTYIYLGGLVFRKKDAPPDKREHYTTQDGLMSNLISSLVETPEGIWVAAQRDPAADPDHPTGSSGLNLLVKSAGDSGKSYRVAASLSLADLGAVAIGKLASAPEGLWVGTLTDGLRLIKVKKIEGSSELDISIIPYRRSEGLIGNLPYQLLSTSEGLFVGTEARLNLIKTRDDGSIENAGYADPRFMVRGPINGLTLMSDGLWVGVYGKLSFFGNDGSTRSYTVKVCRAGNTDESCLVDDSDKEHLLDKGYRVLFPTSNGLWVGTARGLNLIQNDGSVKSYGTAGGLAYNLITSLFATPDSLWVGTTVGLSIFRNGKDTKKIVWTDLGIDPSWASRFVAAPVGMWVGAGNGLWLFKNDGSMRVYGTKDGLSNNHITDLMMTADGLWVATYGGLDLLDETNGSVKKTYKTQNGLTSNDVERLLMTPEGLWAGTRRGVSLIQDGVVKKTCTKEDGLAGDSVWQLLWTSDGLWVGTEDGGLSLLKNGVVVGKPYTTNEGLMGNNIMALLSTSDGLWVGTNDGLSIIWKDGSIQSFKIEEDKVYHRDQVAGKQIDAIIQTDYGVIVGTTMGMTFVEVERDGFNRGVKFRSYYTYDSLAGNYMNHLLFQKGEGLWIGTNHGVSFWSASFVKDQFNCLHINSSDGACQFPGYFKNDL